MSLSKRSAAEFIGTFWLVLGGCGSAVLAAGVPDVGIGYVGVSLAFGLTVLTMAFAIGHPKRRYLVLPNEGEAAWPIGNVVQRLAQLNGNQDYSYSQDELKDMLKVAIAA